MIIRHAELLAALSDERHGLTDLRKHMAWYFKGYPVGGETRRRLGLVTSLAELREILDTLDLDSPYPGVEAEGARGRQGTPKTPSCPEGWLDTRDITPDLEERLREAELSVSGG